jgi:hypothetical protein
MAFSKHFPKATIATLVASALHAATLGEAQVGSWLGQPLSARIRINATDDSPLNRDCFVTTLHDVDSDGALRRTAAD